jgi:hypothetical protein
VVQASAVKPLRKIRIAVNGRTVRYWIRKNDVGQRTLVFEAPLNGADYSIITLHTPEMRRLKPSEGSAKGVANGDIFIEPPTWRHRVQAVWSGLMDLRNRKAISKPAAKPPMCAM